MGKKKEEGGPLVVERLSYGGGTVVARVVEIDGDHFADLHDDGEKVDGFGPSDHAAAVAKWRKLCRKAGMLARAKGGV